MYFENSSLYSFPSSLGQVSPLRLIRILRQMIKPEVPIILDQKDL